MYLEWKQQMINKGINMTRGGLMRIRAAHGGQIDLPPRDLERQVQNVADQGRFGDSMLVHMNPREVQGLAAMSGTGLTTNPQTGQPEAFLPFLAPLLGSLLGPTIFGAMGAGAGSALTGLAGSALGSGLATWAESGDFEKGLSSAVIGFGLGSMAQGGAGAAGGSQAANQMTNQLIAQGPDAAITEGILKTGTPEMFEALGGTGMLPGTVLSDAGEQFAMAQTLGTPENLLAIEGARVGGTQMGTQVAKTQTPLQNLKTTFTDPAGEFDFMGGMKNVAQGGTGYGSMIPIALGGVSLEDQYLMDAQAAKEEEEERKKKEKWAGLLYGARERPPPSSAYYGTSGPGQNLEDQPYKYLWGGAQGGVIRAQAGIGGLPGGLGGKFGGFPTGNVDAFNPNQVPFGPGHPLFDPKQNVGATGPGLGPYTVDTVVDTPPYIDINNPNPYAGGEAQPTVSTASDLPASTDIPPVTTERQWWEDNYASLEDAILSGDWLLDEDGNIVMDDDGDPVPMPEDTTPVVVTEGEDETVVTEGDEEIVEDWWITEGYDSEKEATASGNYVTENGKIVYDAEGNPILSVDVGWEYFDDDWWWNPTIQQWKPTDAFAESQLADGFVYNIALQDWDYFEEYDQNLDDEGGDTEDWWITEGFNTLQEAVDSGLWDVDGNAITPPEDWWVTEGFNSLDEAVDSGLWDIYGNAITPPEDWWVTAGYDTLELAVDSGLWNADGTPVSGVTDPTWWEIKGYTSLQAAIDSGYWDEYGNAIAETYIDIDDEYQDEPQPTVYDEDILPDEPPVTTTPQWWETDYNYASLEDAIASGDWLLDEDGNIVFDEDGDPVAMPEGTTEDWWVTAGFNTLQEAVDTGLWDEYGNSIDPTKEWWEADYGSLQEAMDTGLYNADGTLIVSDTQEWWEADYGSYDEAMATGLYNPDGTLITSDTGTVDWWVTEGFATLDEALATGLWNADGTPIIPEEDWWIGEGFATLDDAVNSGLWNADGTPIAPGPSFNVGDIDPDTGLEWDGVGWVRPDIPITFVWDGAEWIDPSITPVGADIGASDLTHRGYDAKAYAAGMSPEQYQSYLETIGFMPDQGGQPPSAEASQFAKDIAAYAGTEGEYRKDYDIDRDREITIRDSIWQMQIDQGLRYPDGTPVPEFPPLAPADSQMYDPEGYFGQGYTPEDLAQTYGPGAQRAGMSVDEYLTYLDEVSRRGVEGFSGVPVGMPEYGENFPELEDPGYQTTLPTPLGWRGGVDPEWNYFPWSNPPSYEYTGDNTYLYDDDQADDEVEEGGIDDEGIEKAAGGQIKARKAGGGNLARFGNMNIIDFEDEDDPMRRYVMEDTYRAQAGMALPQGQPQGQPNEEQIIMEAQAAILGEHPNPDAAIQAFIIMFGPEAFEAFRQQVLEGAAGGPVQTQGLLQGAGGGMDDTMMGPIGNTGNQLAASPGEVVLPADYVAMAGDGNTDAGAERIMHGAEPLPSVDEMRQFKYGQEEQPPSMDQYLAWKGGKI